MRDRAGAVRSRWVAAAAGTGVRRPWLLDLELAWYGLVLVWILAGHAAGYTAPHRTEFFLLAGVAVLCALAAVLRWWVPAWTGPIALAVLVVGLGVLLALPIGPLGALRLMLSVGIIPVLLAATARRCGRWTALAVVVLAAAAAALDVGLGGNTLSVDLSRQLLGTVPRRPVVVLTGALLVVVPVAIGLLLRSADTAARAEALVRTRIEERLQVARELHDLVANHVTGMIVTAQAAGLADLPDATAGALRDIEGAGNRALAAMQRMVGTLRSADVPDLPPPEPAPSDGPATAWAAVSSAVGADDRVRLHVADGQEPGDPAVELSPEVATTVHRIVTEALTNARRHMPAESLIEVRLGGTRPGVLTLDILNQRRSTPPRTVSGGHGLLGLRERAAAVGGRLDAGPEDDRWRLHAELPCSPAEG